MVTLRFGCGWVSGIGLGGSIGGKGGGSCCALSRSSLPQPAALTLDPPRIRPEGGCPPFYFGGLSEAARDVAAQAADVFLMWPDTMPAVEAVITDMRARAARYGRELKFGYRAHVIVRATEDEARSAARRLISRLDDETGRRLRNQSLHVSSTGQLRQGELRDLSDDDGFVEANLWTGIGRARSGPARPSSATLTRCWPS